MNPNPDVHSIASQYQFAASLGASVGDAGARAACIIELADQLGNTPEGCDQLCGNLPDLVGYETHHGKAVETQYSRELWAAWKAGDRAELGDIVCRFIDGELAELADRKLAEWESTRAAA